MGKTRFQSVALAAVLSIGLTAVLLSRHRSMFLPGRTSDGHHLIEEDCAACHTPFHGVSNESCAACHAAELSHDTHPASLFDDPRWAADLARLDVRTCVSCHREHQVAPAGVTVGARFCFPCHSDVGDRRRSHRGLDPAGCGAAGCHNYHDNSFLNRSYLAKHRREPALLPAYALPARSLPSRAAVGPDWAAVPAGLPAPATVVRAWRSGAHARLGVGCRDCHMYENDVEPSLAAGGHTGRARQRGAGGWTGAGAASGRIELSPGEAACTRCHEFETRTFAAGEHGVRGRQHLPPLSPADARLPMQPPGAARPAALVCATCHDPHSVDTRPAAVQACLRCHDDSHSRNFRGSPHAARDPLADPERPGARTVTCATCHLPRVSIPTAAGARVAVDHGNTRTLRPLDRMAGEVCIHCHGLAPALASLVAEAASGDNFRQWPRQPLRTFSMLDGTPAAEPRETARGPTGGGPGGSR